jgi:hypothetical protein
MQKLNTVGVADLNDRSLNSMTKRDKAIAQIAYILVCGHEHSSEPDAWGTRASRPDEFYYAYSHLSYVCACIWSSAIDDSCDAETFIDLLYNPPECWVSAVRKLIA